MIHGAGMHAGVWGSLVAGLAPMPCQAISLPGHTKNGGQALPSIEKMAAWVGEKLANYPAQSVVLMGHSMGSLVALEAAHFPAVTALVLLGAAAKMPVHPDLIHQATHDPGTASDMILKWGVSPAHTQAATVKAVLKEQMKTVASGVLFNDLTACNNYRHGEEAAKAIRQPVLVLSGQDDKMTKAADGKLLADMIPQAQFHALPACGHMMMVEKPAETAKEISGFIAALGG